MTAESKEKVKEDGYPKIGSPCPDFVLDDVTHYGKKRVALEDFRGKWLILDFWGRGCSACIHSFAQTSRLQKEFKDSVQFLLVSVISLNDKAITKNVYERYKRMYDLNLAVAYDSTLFRRFGVPSFPHLIWIDPHGVVRAITTSVDMTSANLRSIIGGKNPIMTKKLDTKAEDSITKYYNPDVPFLTYGNGGPDSAFLYRSILTGFQKNLVPAFALSFVTYPDNTIFAINTGLKSIYRIA